MRGHRTLIAAVVVACVTMLSACGEQATPSPGSSSAAPSAIASSTNPPPSATAATRRLRWEATGSLNEPNSSHHAHALGDGRVLAIRDDTTVELWDPVTGDWQTTASLNNPRTNFASVSLLDGRVLVAGGLNDVQQSYSSAYLFDPATESWEKAAGLMITARTNPSAAVLPDGRVLVVGGYFHKAPEYGSVPGGTVLAAMRSPALRGGLQATGGSADIVPGPFGAALATAELFDPATGQWSATGSMQYARNGAAITPLADGRILVVGSLDFANTGVEVAAGAVNSAEIYDPSTEQFSPAGQFPAMDLSEAQAAGFELGDFTVFSVGHLVPVPDGGAVLIAHAGYWKHQGEATRSLRFSSTSGTWNEIGETYIFAEHVGMEETFQTPVIPRFAPAVAGMADGRVLVAGGQTGEPGPPITHASAEVYDPATDSWTTLPDMPEPRAGAASVLLDNGSVLLLGGTVKDDEGSAQPLRTALLLTSSP